MCRKALGWDLDFWLIACILFLLGVWRSLVTRMVWDHEIGGSNPLAPTMGP